MSEELKRDSFASRLRNNFLAGLVICAPIAITIWLTLSFIRWADSWVTPYIPPYYNPEKYLPIAIPGLGLLIAMIIITLIGFLGKNLIGRSIFSFGESILHRMPLVRTLYKSLKQIFETVLKEQSTSFRKVGLIEFPTPGTWVIAFISSEPQGELAEKFGTIGQEMVAVFVPPTPVPTAGFLLYVQKDKIVPLDMSPEDATKLLISGGIITPEYKSKLVKTPEEA
ncbi:DUF502 domain-containing protein [Rhizobium sp. NRK18]|uniref:DUF502 domain-containing protein n=1 Tax=Rhizobium sp. NRK18 TaxID=2964667 RepID=UPI0021C3D042|nr:DUF502 domain-containing protein [Rhizobium sp. NRK18]MCQ2004109.1 DUF502 domain-containing protein [Rhizobium sp. NRK18]